MTWLAIWISACVIGVILWILTRKVRAPDCFGQYLGGNVQAERDCYHCGYYEDCRKETDDAQANRPLH